MVFESAAVVELGDEVALIVLWVEENHGPNQGSSLWIYVDLLPARVFKEVDLPPPIFGLLLLIWVRPALDAQALGLGWPGLICCPGNQARVKKYPPSPTPPMHGRAFNLYGGIKLLRTQERHGNLQVRQ